jgi:hypothetical protein
MRSGWYVVGVVASATTAITCYRPNAETECALTCETTCPGSLVCGSDSLCHATGAPNCTDRSREFMDAPPVLDAPDSGSGSGSNSNCFGSPNGHLQVCPTTMPATRIITAQNIDTTTSLECERTAQIGASGMVCAIVGTTIQITGQVQATGQYPLAFVATDSIEVDADISAASHFAIPTAGAGGGRDCGAQAGGSGNGGGGGAGGGFGTLGGSGGAGYLTVGGAQSPAQTPVSIIGGCNGGAGGSGAGHPGSVAGLGGGAVYLISRTQIVLAGNINASGGAGAGGQATAGGAGGGAGGIIGLDAPSITYASGTLLAAGAGGGQGGDGAPGGNGFDPTYAAGGAGGNLSLTCAGSGGKGAYSGGASSGSSTAGVSCGAGGGGGGDGYIFVTGPTSGGHFIPAARP